jgi:hypothetical protein
MSTITFREEYTKQHIANDKKKMIKQSIIDGTLGLSFVYMDKNDDKVHRIFVKEDSENSTFTLTEDKNGKETTKTISLSDFLKLIKEPHLKFVADYWKGRKPAKADGEKKSSKKGGTISGGAKKRSKKASKKSSKKGGSLSGGAKKRSKKASKKSSKKASKKSSKKGSKKGGSLTGGAKKRSKKSSKKSSLTGGAKKRSKKSSKKSSLTGGAKKRSKKASKKASKKRSKKGTK